MKQKFKFTGAATLAAALTTAIYINQNDDVSIDQGPDSQESRKIFTPSKLSSSPSNSQFSKQATGATEIAEGSVEEILADLHQAGSQQKRVVLADALALIGSEQAIKGLLQFVKTLPNLDERVEVLEAFQALSNPEALPALASALTEDSDSRTLKASIEALGRLADSATINHLVERYQIDPAVKTQRGQIAQALANITNSDTARTLASVARTSPEPGLVEAAARALSKIGTTTAAQGLVDARDRVGESDPVLRDSLSELIRRLDHPEGKRLLANLQNDQSE